MVKKTSQYNIRVSSDMDLKMLRSATELGMSVQDYIRHLITLDNTSDNDTLFKPSNSINERVRQLEKYRDEEKVRLNKLEDRVKEVEENREKIITIIKNQYTKICDKLGISIKSK